MTDETMVTEAERMARYRELRKMTKVKLAVKHSANGGLLSAVEYIKWKHEELVNAVLEDEGLL